MLELYIPKVECYDERTERFISISDQRLKLEHSLLSIYEWESKWHKPFLSKTQKTNEESLDYIRCMTLNINEVDERVFSALNASQIITINSYIENPMTATTFNDRENRHFSREIITAEIIYYWMVSLEIPFECEKWHLNKLLTLIKVCNIKNAPSKKMSSGSIAKQNRMLNAARRQKFNSNG